jgi:phenylpropionate dioxygenase-like ring-hydroxylating dioxygenase large terminal subunit
MKTPDSVLRFYHPVAIASAVGRSAPFETQLLGATYTLTRDGSGAIAARCSDPAKKPRVLETNGSIWIADHAFAEPPKPEVDFSAEEFVHADTARVTFQAPLHVAFDNFSEDEHTPWVHSFLGWKENDAAQIHFEAENFDDRTEVYYRGLQRPHALTPALLVRWGDEFHNRWITTFNPIRTVYTLHWASPGGGRRPVTSRFAIYFVPESDQTTVLHVLSYAKIASPFQFLKPIVHALVPRIGASEVVDDQRFASRVAHTPFEFTGMRLGRFDAPLVHNRKLMKLRYFSNSES